MEQVDRHLDTSCPGPDAPQPPTPISGRRGGNNFASSSRTPSSRSADPPPARLPAISYSMLKDTALRKKLAELGISSAGSRQVMEKRHQEWVTIWNANCDSAFPKTRQELLHDLNVWEKTMGSRAPTSSKAAITGAQIKEKDFDGGAWAAKHDSSFKDLIANARRTRELAKQKASEAAKEEEEKERQKNDGAAAAAAAAAPVPAAVPVAFYDYRSMDPPPSSQPDVPEAFGVNTSSTDPPPSSQPDILQLRSSQSTPGPSARRS